MATYLVPENGKKYYCKICDYTTSRIGQYDRHNSTSKHIKVTNGNGLATKNVKTNDFNNYTCEQCFKSYKDRSGLWKHKKKCVINNINVVNNTKINNNKINDNNNDNDNDKYSDIKTLTNLVYDLVKTNTDLQKQMLDVCKNSNSTINSHNNNKTFNLQVFLNEKCKDAMNIMDFVNSMTLQLSDLEDIGNLGYVEGMSKIIIQKLNEIDIYKRPIHCSDAKRDTVYVRDNDVWEKDNITYDKLRKAIKYITKKNGELLVPWSEKHPSCMNIEHPQNDIYMRLMSQAMGGKEEFVCSENKIIKKISKAIIIDKM